MPAIHFRKENGKRQSRIAEVDPDDLRLDPDNVRFRHIALFQPEVDLTQERIEQQIWSEPDTRELFRQIVSAGGLLERPLVTKDSLVKEGNRRVVCCRKAKELLHKGKLNGMPKGTFDEIEVEMLEGGTTPKELAVYLAVQHVKGKKPWAKLNRAEHITRLHKQENMTIDEIREAVGMGKRPVLNLLQAFERTLEFIREDPKHRNIYVFSYFQEALSRKQVRDWLEADPHRWDEFRSWIAGGKFNDLGPADVRRLPIIIADDEALKIFGQDGKGVKEALAVAERRDPALRSPAFAAVNRAAMALDGMPRWEFKQLKKDTPKIVALRDLRSKITEVLAEAGLR